jgi:O-antigen/teichoic acid export membrane protein
MIIARKIAYNVVVSSIAKFFSTFLALISIGLIARYLGKEGFGNYAVVLAFLSFFTAISDLGLYSTTTREISRPKANETEILGKIFSLRIIISIFIFLISPLVIWFFPYPLEVKKAIIIVAFSFIFSSTYQILNGLFQKNLAMDKVAISELLGKILQVAFVFFAIQLNLSFLWIIASLLINMTFSFGLIYFFSRKYSSFKLSIDIPYWKNFIKESYPLGIAAFVTFIYFKIDTIMLSVLKSSEDVGIYNAAYKIIENITFFPAMIMGLIFPLMSKNIFFNKKIFSNISDKTYKIFWVIVIPLVIGTIFFAEEIIFIIGGADFSDSVLVLRILIFALAFIFFGNFFNAILISANKQKKLMQILFFAAIFNVLGNLIFIPKYSYLAAGVISVLTEMLVVSGTFYITFKEIKYIPKLKNFSGIIISGGLMAGCFFIFSQVSFLILAPLGVLVYSLSLWVFKVIKSEEIFSIISKK